jgi:hypothetical protein
VPTLPTPTPTPTAPPMITSQPMDTTVPVGRRARFSVTATGAEPLSYQWTKNGTTIIGATRMIYTSPPTTRADNGALFAVVVTNPGGNVTSDNATLTVKRHRSPPTITAQPVDTIVNLGDRAKVALPLPAGRFSIASGQRMARIISGATKRSYTTPPTTTGDNGTVFAVTITNSVGSVTSSMRH